MGWTKSQIQAARSAATIAAAQYPDPVIVRMSDFKTNEYAKLIGGQQALSWCGELACLNLEQAPSLIFRSMELIEEDLMICADFVKGTAS